MPRYDERQLSDVDRRKGWHGCGGHDELAMRQRSLQLAGVSGAPGSCARGCRGEGLSKGGTRVRSGDTEKTEKENNSLRSEEERKTSTLPHTLCAVQMYARVSRRAYTPFHAMPCQAMSSHAGEGHAEATASRDRSLSQDHRTHDTPHPIVHAHPILHLFLPPRTKPCTEAVIAAGVEAAMTVEEGATVEVVVVHLEAEVAAGMSHSHSSATQTHDLSAYLQRANLLLSTLAFPTLPRTD